MNKIILTLLLTVSNVFANTYVGVVKDVSTGSPIADANIVVSGIEEIGLTTNEKGFFSLHTDTDSIMIRVNAIGYTQYSQSYNTNENEFIYISMDKKSIELSPVEVIADRTSLIGATKNFFRLAGSSSLISSSRSIHTRRGWLRTSSKYRDEGQRTREERKNQYDGGRYTYCSCSIFFSCGILFSDSR